MPKVKHLPFEALRPVIQGIHRTRTDGFTKEILKVYYDRDTLWPEAASLHHSNNGAPIEYFDDDEGFKRIRHSPDPNIRRLYKQDELTEDAQVLRQKKEGGEGTIKRLTDKSFGFIKTEKGKDLFFHSSSLQGISFEELREGQKVTYKEGYGQKGPCAENVKPL